MSDFPRDAWYAICPRCSALGGEPCRTLTTRRVTDTHTARFGASYALRAEHAREEHLRLLSVPSS